MRKYIIVIDQNQGEKLMAVDESQARYITNKLQGYDQILREAIANDAKLYGKMKVGKADYLLSDGSLKVEIQFTVGEYGSTARFSVKQMQFAVDLQEMWRSAIVAGLEAISTNSQEHNSTLLVLLSLVEEMNLWQ